MADPALFENEVTASSAPAGPSGPEAGIGDVITAPTSAVEIWRRFRKNKLALIGLGFIALLILSAVFARFIVSYGPYEIPTTGGHYKAGPSSAHWFGTDRIGRDVFARVIYGGQLALRVGFAASAIAIVIGTVFGVLAGFFGGWLDNLLMRITDIFLAIPYIVLASAIAVVFGRDEKSVIIILGVTGWLAIARIVRATVLQLKQLEYIEAANALGYTRSRVMWRHILPNALQPIIVYGTIEIGGVILSAAALSFLGIGVPAGTADWGSMIADNKGELNGAAHLVFFPGLAIFLTVLAFIFIGDGLRDALDPRLRGQE
jgi:ABC-type dipeptide/oligopeptide/nickel transport system permease subunit